MVMLVIDVGSSSLRVLLMNEDATPVPDAIARREYRFDRDKQGKATVHPQMLRALLKDGIDEILQHPRADKIDAVGMATFVSNVVGVDDKNTPVTDLITYADTRSTKDVAMLRDALNEDDVHQHTGCLLHTMYYPGQLSYLRRTSPEMYQQINTWLDFGTYCYREWFGRDVPMGVSVASWSGLLNRQTLQWDDNLCDAIDVNRDTLPDVADIGAVQQGLRATYAKRWTQLADVPFFLAVGDGAAANIGSGAVNEKYAALTIGTTAAFRIVGKTAQQSIPAGLWQYRVDGVHTLTGGATSEGGNLYAWARKTLQLPDEATLEAALLEREPGAHGLTIVPLLAGERSPGWQADATGTISGIQLSTTPIDIAQALQESLAINLAEIAARLNLSADVQVMAGGAAVVKSVALRQMLANALNRQIFIPNVDEVTARGVAILIQAHRQQGDFPDFYPDIKAIIDPQPEYVRIMQVLHEQQQALYQMMYS